jgi:oxygen-independent coproporphyrinogen-3 oxidase
MKLVQKGDVHYEYEEPDHISAYHEYLLISLRTMWGTDLDVIRRIFGQGFASYCLLQAEPFLQTGRMVKDGSKLILSEEGMFIANHIMKALFMTKG